MWKIKMASCVCVLVFVCILHLLQDLKKSQGWEIERLIELEEWMLFCMQLVTAEGCQSFCFYLFCFACLYHYALFLLYSNSF